MESSNNSVPQGFNGQTYMQDGTNQGEGLQANNLFGVANPQFSIVSANQGGFGMSGPQMQSFQHVA
jgi:hypothetical protein